MRKWLLNEFTGEEIRQALEDGRVDCAVIVFGSCENHGHHLPLGPDLFVPMEMARRIAEELDNVVVLPGMPFGASVHYSHYPLAVSLQFQTMVALAEDILRSLVDAGFERLILLNGHDGNIPALEIAARNIKHESPEATLIYVPAWWEITARHMPGAFGDWQGLGHGGEGETSVTWAVRPDLVDMEQAVRQMPEDVIRYGDTATVIWDISEITDTGATGDPGRADPVKGDAMIQRVADELIGLIRALDASDWRYDRWR